MSRRLLAVAGICGTLALAPAAPAVAQSNALLIDDLVGKWTVIYIDGATCAYGDITIGKVAAEGHATALFKVSCGGINSVYEFSVLNTGRSDFMFYGVATNGPNGVGPNRLKYELTFNKLDCSLSGRWFIEDPIGRLVLRKVTAC